MKILRNNFLSVFTAMLILFSSCSVHSGFLSQFPWSIFKQKKVKTSSIVRNAFTKTFHAVKNALIGIGSIFKQKKVKKTNTVTNTVIGAGVAFFTGITAYFLGKRNGGNADGSSGGSSFNGKGDSSESDEKPEDDKPSLNWQDMHVRMNELLKSLNGKGRVKSSRKINVGGVVNNIYQFESSGQKGARCGPSALFNASKLSQYFDMKKRHTESIGFMKRLNDQTTRKQVEELAKTRDVEWLRSDELADVLFNKSIPGLELNRNAFVYPALSFYSRSRSVAHNLVRPLYDMNIKEKEDGFSCSFIVPDFETEFDYQNGHWICIHLVKTKDVCNWFVVCSLNSNILENNYWWERIQFMIYMLLDESPHKLSFANNIVNEKVEAQVEILDDMTRKIKERKTKAGFQELKNELDGMKMLYLIPGCKKRIDTYKGIVNALYESAEGGESKNGSANKKSVILNLQKQ